MINIHWSLIVLVIVVVFLIYKATTEDTSGDYNFNFMPIVWFALIIVALIIYGGVFWW